MSYNTVDRNNDTAEFGEDNESVAARVQEALRLLDVRNSTSHSKKQSLPKSRNDERKNIVMNDLNVKDEDNLESQNQALHALEEGDSDDMAKCGVDVDNSIDQFESTPNKLVIKEYHLVDFVEVPDINQESEISPMNSAILLNDSQNDAHCSDHIQNYEYESKYFPEDVNLDTTNYKKTDTFQENEGVFDGHQFSEDISDEEGNASYTEALQEEVENFQLRNENKTLDAENSNAQQNRSILTKVSNDSDDTFMFKISAPFKEISSDLDTSLYYDCDDAVLSVQEKGDESKSCVAGPVSL